MEDERKEKGRERCGDAGRESARGRRKGGVGGGKREWGGGPGGFKR